MAKLLNYYKALNIKNKLLLILFTLILSISLLSLLALQISFSIYDEQLINEFIAGLGRINSEFKPEWIEEFVISRAKYAQSICTVGFGKIMPDHITPIKGLYITDSTQFYPEDRTISGAIRVGRKTAGLIKQDAL